MTPNNLSALRNQLEREARNLGARVFGVADLAPAESFIQNQGGGFLTHYPRAVSMGVSLQDGIVDQLPHHREITVARTYDYLYDTVNASLNRIALRVSVILNDAGFQTLLIPASQTLDTENGIGLFSHKLAAHLAGLGWIGPSCLLITPEFGPRIRLITVLTDASLETGKPLQNRCGDCRQCVDACPPNAFSGRIFSPEEPRDVRFNVKRCMGYRANLQKNVTGARVCGMCVYVCPYGRKENGRLVPPGKEIKGFVEPT
ncbi:MAG TPA: epoxyqueuosine reductase [Desulfobacteraceae bacterium]|nr:epoxyqueuosine reductase [Desulfobacteraceae bacterium]